YTVIDLLQLTSEFEFGGRSKISDDIQFIGLNGAVVDPLVRVADLRAAPRELIQRFLDSFRTHPGRVVDRVGVGLDQALDQRIHGVLSLCWEILGYVQLTNVFPDRTFGEGNTALPTVLELLNPAELGGVEGEVFVDEIAGEEWGEGTQHLHTQP